MSALISGGGRRRNLVPAEPVDLRLTLGPLRRGRGDPTMRFAADGVWRATRTPHGAATVQLRSAGPVVEATAWGAGAVWALDHVDELIGARDEPSSFRPAHPLVARLHRRLPGLRIPRSRALLEALVPSICEQKVTGLEARRSWYGIVRRWGSPAPGPADLLLPPDPAVLARVPYYELHRCNLERKRADTIRRACALAGRLERLVDGPIEAATARLTTVTGIGAWTAAEVGLVALGDADAVSVGDYHLAHQVCFALAGEARGSDQRMLELLAPFAGHRGRVCRLLVLAGLGPPRRGPRPAPRRIARL